MVWLICSDLVVVVVDHTYVSPPSYFLYAKTRLGYFVHQRRLRNRRSSGCGPHSLVHPLHYEGSWLVHVHCNGGYYNPERNGLFHPVFFRILHPEAIQYLSLNPKNFDLGIRNSKLKLFC